MKVALKNLFFESFFECAPYLDAPNLGIMLLSIFLLKCFITSNCMTIRYLILIIKFNYTDDQNKIKNEYIYKYKKEISV